MRPEILAGIGLILGGTLLTIASFTAMGSAQSWDMADAMAADSIRPVRRMGMLLGALGVALTVAATPILITNAFGTGGYIWILMGWIAFALGAILFVMVFGVVAIVMPALGELAQSSDISPQQLADQFTRQSSIFAAFIGGNMMFLSWIPLGVGLTRTALFPDWAGWFVAVAAVAAWLNFLHVPVFQQYAGPFWPVSILLLGILILFNGLG